MDPPSIRKCQGVPQVGTRALTADEIALWSEKLVAHSRTRGGYRVLTWTAAVAMPICSGLLADARLLTLSEPKSLVGFGFRALACGCAWREFLGRLGRSSSVSTDCCGGG
jgi:hypothetical protein